MRWVALRSHTKPVKSGRVSKRVKMNDILGKQKKQKIFRFMVILGWSDLCLSIHISKVLLAVRPSVLHDRPDFSRYHYVCVYVAIVSCSHRGKMCGICGNCNGNDKDDIDNGDQAATCKKCRAKSDDEDR